MRLGEAYLLSADVLDRLKHLTSKSSMVGSVRRQEPWIGDLDILIEINEKDIGKIKRELSKFSTIHSGGDRKLRIGNIFNTDMEGDVWLVYEPRNFYALQAIFTGPADLTIKMRELLERNGYERPHSELRVSSEAEVFQLCGLPFLEPSERHTLV